MTFVIPDTFLKNLHTIRADYENRSQKILDKSSQPYALTRYFGAKDVSTRDKQTKFIDKWLWALDNMLKPYGYCLQLNCQIRPKDESIVPNRLYLYLMGDSIECAAKDAQGKVERIVLDAELGDFKDAIIAPLKDSSNQFNETALDALFAITASKGFRGPKLEFSTNEETENYLTAIRILMAVSLYIKSQIDDTYSVRNGCNAILGDLLERAAKLGKDNFLDEESRAACLLTTQDFLNAKDRLLEVNRNLTTPFTIVEWHKFSKYINDECASLDQKYTHYYPFTTLLVPLFTFPMQMGGCAMGYVAGDMIGKSSAMVSSKMAVTAIFGSGLVCLMGPSAAMGVLILAPSIAGKLLDYFCGVSMAYLMGAAMGLIGASVGWGLGMTLDEGWHLLYKACALIASTYHGKARLPNLTGFTIVNGHRVVNGIELEVIELTQTESSTDENYEQQQVLFSMDENGFILQIGKEKAKIPWDLKNLPYVNELKAKFQEKQAQSPVIEQKIDLFDDDLMPCGITP